MANNPTDKPTTVCLQQPDELKQVFDRFDVNGDGKISAKELSDVMKALGSETSDEELARMMSEIDTEKDGFINLQEFAGFCKIDQNNDGGVQELKDAFDLYDKGKDGLISTTELHEVLTQLGEVCSVQDCVKMIVAVDSDGDGSVNFEEFKKMVTNNKT